MINFTKGKKRGSKALKRKCRLNISREQEKIGILAKVNTIVGILGQLHSSTFQYFMI